jgi:serine/threonine protein kinase
VKLCDFGVSAVLERSFSARESSQGTKIYMSPERLETKPYTFPVDIWSLGLILYEGAAGRYPVRDIPEEMLVLKEKLVASLDFRLPGYSAEFVDFLKRCLEEAPERRVEASQCRNMWPGKFRDEGQEDLQEWITSHGFGAG